MKIDAIGIPRPSNDVAAPVEHSKGIARLERARSAFLKGDVRLDIERRRLLTAEIQRRRHAPAADIVVGQAASRAGWSIVLARTSVLPVALLSTSS